MSTGDPPFDTGLQLERTLLAWQRTTLAVAVLSAVGVRFSAPLIGWPAVSVGVAGLALAVACYLLTNKRYREVHRALHRDGIVPASGWPQAALAGATVVLGVAAVVYLLAHPG